MIKMTLFSKLCNLNTLLFIKICNCTEIVFLTMMLSCVYIICKQSLLIINDLYTYMKKKHPFNIFFIKCNFAKMD